MIEMKMSMWEKMGDGAVKEKIYESIQDLFDKSEDLQTQLQDVGSEESVCVCVCFDLRLRMSYC